MAGERRRMTKARILAAPLLVIGLIGGAASAAAPNVVGIAAAIVNDVRIKGSAARQYARAALRQRVAMADQVQTGGASRLQLLLLDKSKFTVGPNARLTIDRFVYDPQGSAMSASVAKGAFRFMSGKTAGRKERSISSPAATIGIRGTLLDGVVGPDAIAIARGERELRGNIEHDPATATLVVLRGPGPRNQGSDAVGAVDVTAGGETVTLDSPLQAAYVPRAGARPITFEISSPGIARLNDMLIEPRDVLSDPNAAPVFAPTQPDRPSYDRPYYDRPGPGGFDDGPGGGFGPGGPGGYGPGGYGPGNIPGLNGLPSRPDRPQRPDRRQTPTPTPPASTPTPSSTPTSDTAPSPPARLTLPVTPTPSQTPTTAPPSRTAPTPQKSPTPTPTPTPVYSSPSTPTRSQVPAQTPRPPRPSPETSGTLSSPKQQIQSQPKPLPIDKPATLPTQSPSYQNSEIR